MITLKVGCLLQLSVAKEALKFISKTGMHTTFDAHWKLMLPWVDGVLHALLRNSRAATQTDEAVHQRASVIGRVNIGQGRHGRVR